MSEDNEELLSDADDDDSSTFQNTEDREIQPDGIILGDDDDTIVDTASLNMSNSNSKLFWQQVFG